MKLKVSLVVHLGILYSMIFPKSEVFEICRVIFIQTFQNLWQQFGIAPLIEVIQGTCIGRIA